MPRLSYFNFQQNLQHTIQLASLAYRTLEETGISIWVELFIYDRRGLVVRARSLGTGGTGYMALT